MIFSICFSKVTIRFIPSARLGGPGRAIIESPNFAPSEASIASPATIMIALSRNPNPTNGTCNRVTVPV